MLLIHLNFCKATTQTSKYIYLRKSLKAPIPPSVYVNSLRKNAPMIFPFFAQGLWGFPLGGRNRPFKILSQGSII